MLRSYVRQYRMPLIFALLLYLICLAVLLLSALPTHAVLYALGLGAVVGLAMLVLGYFPYARRHKLLRELDIRDSLEHLPQPVSSIEEDYQHSSGSCLPRRKPQKPPPQTATTIPWIISPSGPTRSKRPSPPWI